MGGDERSSTKLWLKFDANRDHVFSEVCDFFPVLTEACFYANYRPAFVEGTTNV